MGIKRVHRALASVAATALIAGVTVVGTTGVVEAARPAAGAVAGGGEDDVAALLLEQNQEVDQQLGGDLVLA